MKKTIIRCNDNLAELKKLPGESVDMVYIDPPFFTRRSWGDFKDTWKGIDEYMGFMKPRLEEIRRVLKPTGSVLVHGDQHATHHVKVAMDGLFGMDNFRGEIFWFKKAGHNSFKELDHRVDSILYYAKSKDHEYKPQHLPVPKDAVEKIYPHVEAETGRRFAAKPLERKSNAGFKEKSRVFNGKKVDAVTGWTWSQKHVDEFLAKNPNGIYWSSTGRPYYKIYTDDFKGLRVTNAWTDIKNITHADEEFVYATQKPEPLIERIVNMTTSPGDTVLDAFAGSGTTCAVAKKLGRKSICIDQNPKACSIMEARLK